MKYLLFVFDGLADFPGRETPLSKANKPNMNYLASKGDVFRLRLIERKMWNEETRASVSHIANTSLLGYDPKKFNNKRGVLEAISANINYKNGWLALRVDFSTLENGIVIDRRAGRNIYGLDELSKDLNKIKIGVPFEFKRTYGHRAVLVVKKNLSDKIQTNDPLSNNLPPKEIKALNKNAKTSEEILKKFVEKSYRILKEHEINKQRVRKGLLPANYLLFREPGNKLKAFKPLFTEKYKVKAIAIAEKGVMKATCMLAGFDSLEIPEGLSYKEGIKYIFEKIEELLPSYDFIYSHIKWTDEAAHDKDFEKKRRVIEEFDKYLENYREFKGKILITTDHITSCKTGKHEFGDVPLLIYPGRGAKKFDEIEAYKRKIIKPKQLWKIVFHKF